MSDVVYANAFGTDFPVCNEDQKVRMEVAFDSAMEYERTHPDSDAKCSCDLLIDLLSENPSRTAVIIAANVLAKDLYNKKAGIAFAIQDLLEAEEF